MVMLFISHIRPIIDYCSSLWNVGYLGDVRLLESVQRRWTKQVAGLENLDYGVRLRALGLFSIRGRLLRSDLIKYWKAFNSTDNVGLLSIFELAPETVTRGHPFKLRVPVCSTELRRRFFSVRAVNIWNNLPSEVVGAASLEAFKGRLLESLGDLLYYYD